MTNRTIGFRCPLEIVQEIESRATATGRSPTQVVVEILTQTLLRPASSASQATASKRLQQSLSELQNQIEAIARYLAESKEYALDTKLLSYVESLEKTANDLQKSLP